MSFQARRSKRLAPRRISATDTEKSTFFGLAQGAVSMRRAVLN
jgi:hypothetical protein